MADVLVTGTDTGVGKTVVAASLLLALREHGVKAIGFKPAETGLIPGQLADSQILAAASGVDEPCARPVLRLTEPLAPALAAERAGASFDPAMAEARLAALREAGYATVVEGAGGLLVPLTWAYTVLDFAARTGLAAVIVARAGLGTLNQTVLTVEALRARDVGLRGVVLNARSEPPDLAEETNPAALGRLLRGVPVVVLPRYATSDPLEAARRSVRILGELLAP